MPATSTTGPAPPLTAVSFALWGTAALDGRTSLDEASAAIGGGRRHRLTGIPGELGSATLAVALGRLRGAGARAFGVALCAPGDPLGVSGPRAYTEAVVAAGQAVLVPHLHIALVPSGSLTELGAHVEWEVWSDLPEPPAPESVASAARGLREAVLGASEALAELDAPATPEAEPVDRRSSFATPPGFDPRAHELLDRADRILTGIRAALSAPTVSTSASLDTRRRTALAPVERAARRALVAACHPALAELRRL